MNKKNVIECESNRIERWSRFQLSHQWKRIGIVVSIIALTVLIGLKFFDGEFLAHKFFLRRSLLVGLLIIALSKDKIEDEMITSIRAKSFTLAFVLAVLYSLIQPLVNVTVFYMMGKQMIDPDFSYFQVLSFMLFIQILFFEVLKRNR